MTFSLNRKFNSDLSIYTQVNLHSHTHTHTAHTAHTPHINRLFGKVIRLVMFSLIHSLCHIAHIFPLIIWWSLLLFFALSTWFGRLSYYTSRLITRYTKRSHIFVFMEFEMVLITQPNQAMIDWSILSINARTHTLTCACTALSLSLSLKPCSQVPNSEWFESYYDSNARRWKKVMNHDDTNELYLPIGHCCYYLPELCALASLATRHPNVPCIHAAVHHGTTIARICFLVCRTYPSFMCRYLTSAKHIFQIKETHSIVASVR